MKSFIIDDDSISIYLTQNVLKKAGLLEGVSSFLSAEEALKFLLQDFPRNIPQVIFLDLNMPGMNGWQFLDELTLHKEHLINNCWIYILTSSLNISDTAKSKEYQLVYGLIHKPLDKFDILEILFQLEK